MTKEQMEAVFAEWDRRYREDPGAFEADVTRYLRGDTTEDYGEQATATFLGIAEDLGFTGGIQS